MRIKLLLSGIKDFDLLALSQHNHYRIGEEIKRALRMYVRSDMRSIMLPDERGAPQEVLIEQKRISITLNEKSDRDVIEWLAGIQPGCKSTAIKSVFRNMLEAPYLVGMDKIEPLVKKTIKRTERSAATMRRKESAPGQKEITIPVQKDRQDEDEFDLFSDAFVGNR